MASVDDRMDKHAEKIVDLDRRVTRHDVRLDGTELRLESGTKDMAELRGRMDIQHSETTRQLSTVGASLGAVEGSLKTLKWVIPVAISASGVLIALAGLAGRAFGVW